MLGRDLEISLTHARLGDSTTTTTLSYWAVNREWQEGRRKSAKVVSETYIPLSRQTCWEWHSGEESTYNAGDIWGCKQSAGLCKGAHKGRPVKSLTPYCELLWCLRCRVGEGSYSLAWTKVLPRWARKDLDSETQFQAFRMRELKMKSWEKESL